jgi:hypothetical protein
VQVIFRQTPKVLPMWLYRFLLMILGGSCLVILSAALTRTAASVASSPTALIAEPSTVPPAPAPRPDAVAERCLEQALEALKPERVQWLETAIWQKVQLPGYIYEADGSYQLAPGQRFRMEMHMQFGAAEGTLLMVSDGREVWQGERPGGGTWENVTRLNLPEVFSVMNGPSGPQLRSEFLQRPHFQGMTPLLRNLRGRLVWARHKVLRRPGEEQIQLIGVWPKEDARRLAPPDESWPIGLPRQCHLYLDVGSYWPRRVEWWGPTRGAVSDRLLVQMEFRNPVFNRPLPADVCARLFAFQPGNVAVEDETASVAAEMSRRAGELARH